MNDMKMALPIGCRQTFQTVVELFLFLLFFCGGHFLLFSSGIAYCFNSVKSLGWSVPPTFRHFLTQLVVLASPQLISLALSFAFLYYR
jgi:hypothetical protein